jgi:SAM-dependent methyltransferase
VNLKDLFRRYNVPQPWLESEALPWHDHEFSQRILKEHLSQKHDAASRRSSLVKKQVGWIHAHVLDTIPSRILDLACGPGLYTSRLAELGHTTVGIDISPASIAYAREHAPASCDYLLGDIRDAAYGSGFDLAMLVFGGLNDFKPEEAYVILEKVHQSLKVGGRLLLEALTFEAVHESGHQFPGWYRAENEFFAEAPHLCLTESFWDDDLTVAMERYFIIDVGTGGVVCYVNTTQAYTDQQYTAILRNAHFDGIQVYPSLTGKNPRMQQEMTVIVAEKKEQMQ